MNQEEYINAKTLLDWIVIIAILAFIAPIIVTVGAMLQVKFFALRSNAKPIVELSCLIASMTLLWTFWIWNKVSGKRKIISIVLLILAIIFNGFLSVFMSIIC